MAPLDIDAMELIARSKLVAPADAVYKMEANTNLILVAPQEAKANNTGCEPGNELIAGTLDNGNLSFIKSILSENIFRVLTPGTTAQQAKLAESRPKGPVLMPLVIPGLRHNRFKAQMLNVPQA